MPKIISNLSEKYTFDEANKAFKLDEIKNPELDKYDGKPKDEISVIVGDDKQPDKFYPQVKLERWSNETNFSIRLIDNETGKEEVKTDKEKIIWEKGNIKIENYDFTEDEGGFKFVWYLKKKPTTNKVEFTIQSKGLDFFLQPPLTEEFQNGYSKEFQKEILVTETQVKDLEGNVLVHRPENVVGSYAVYHSTKGGMNDKDGKDYKTGKAFHIYRPHIIDANGAETWGILHIENGIYSVEIPQEFLDTSVYPIKSNDTFGYTTAGASTARLWGYINSSRFSMGASAGTVSTISAYTDLYNTTGAIKTCIYLFSDKSKVAESAEHTEDSLAYAWRTMNITASVSASTDYALTVWGNNSANNMKYDAGTANYGAAQLNTTYGAWASTLASTFNQSIFYSIYATYTAAASGPANLKSLNTNLKANIKSINTNLIANVKSFNTNV